MGVAFAVPLVEDVGGAPPVAVLLVPPEGVAASACEPKIAPIFFSEDTHVKNPLIEEC
jgi:hypothetical protein